MESFDETDEGLGWVTEKLLSEVEQIGFTECCLDLVVGKLSASKLFAIY